MSTFPKMPAIVGVVVASLSVFVFFGTFSRVSPGHVGIVTTFGAVHNTVFQEGWNWKRPIFDNVIQIDTRLAHVEATADSASRDLQMVTTDVDVQFSVNPAMAARMFQRVGDRNAISDTVVRQAVQESVKAVTAKYNAEQLITNRSVVKSGIHEAIIKYIDATLREKELLGVLNIANVAITNFEFSKEFNSAIEAKVRAEQEALKAENQKKERITKAEASAAEIRIDAKARAYSIEQRAEAAAYQVEIESKARAAAIEREGNALRKSPEIVQLRIAERWDGILPRITSGFVPFLNLEGQAISPGVQRQAQ